MDAVASPPAASPTTSTSPNSASRCAHGTPPVKGYYILHEGPIGLLADKLADPAYKDLEKPMEPVKSENGWLGFTDKYWAATLLPNTDAKVRARFSAGETGGLKTYQTDYLLPAQTIASGASGNANARLFAGAKEVSVVGVNFPFGPGGYNQALGLNHFDLLIDWGWFYFLTKPMFLALDYFFHLIGNFGIAILRSGARTRSNHAEKERSADEDNKSVPGHERILALRRAGQKASGASRRSGCRDRRRGGVPSPAGPP